MKAFLVLTAALAIVQGQITIQGKCKEENVVPDFNVEKYGGLWYEIHRYEQYFEKDAECVTAQYTLEDGVVKVLNSRVTGGTSWRLAGSANSAPDAEGKGKLNVMFPSIGNIVGKYWVLATDYTGYSLVYSCRDVGDGNINVSSWILSRKPKLTPQQILAINPSVESATGLAWDNYRETSHSEADCKITSTVQ